MRNYALHCAEMAGSPDASPMALLRHWLARRHLVKLAAANGTAAEFSGITAADLQWAIRLPLSTNPRLALEDRLFRKARACSKVSLAAAIERRKF